MKPIRVVLAEDHPVVREGIRTLLERAPDLVVVAEASDGQARGSAPLKPLAQSTKPPFGGLRTRWGWV